MFGVISADPQRWEEQVAVTSKPLSFIHKHTVPENSDWWRSTMSGSILLRHHPPEEEEALQEVEEEEMGEMEIFMGEELEEELLIGITDDGNDK